MRNDVTLVGWYDGKTKVSNNTSLGYYPYLGAEGDNWTWILFNIIN